MKETNECCQNVRCGKPLSGLDIMQNGRFCHRCIRDLPEICVKAAKIQAGDKFRRGGFKCLLICLVSSPVLVKYREDRDTSFKVRELHKSTCEIVGIENIFYKKE